MGIRIPARGYERILWVFFECITYSFIKILKKKYNLSIYKKDGRETLLILLGVYCKLDTNYNKYSGEFRTEEVFSRREMFRLNVFEVYILY